MITSSLYLFYHDSVRFLIYGTGPFLIVWRESVEALLVIGILYAWVNNNDLKDAKNKLWIGTAGGAALAILLAFVFWFAGNWLSGVAGDWFFSIMMAIAGLLILQMVVWMHRHGRTMKAHLETEAANSLHKSGNWGIAFIALAAIAREGSEIVIFLYGQAVNERATSSLIFILGTFAGFAAGFLTFYLLQLFRNAISWKWFFHISEFALLLLGGAMMVGAIDRLYQIIPNYDVPEFVYTLFETTLWSTDWLISDNSTLTSLTGYHAEPSIIQFGILLLYWGSAILLCCIGNANRHHPRIKTA